MGIKGLNYFIKKKCKKAIQKIHLQSLAGKTIAIDTSIYLYKFKAESSIFPSIFRMCSILKHYDINPIFVFDGKPPATKATILESRRLKKEAAEAKYKNIKEQIAIATAADKWELENKLKKLERQFIRIKNAEIRLVKQLFKYYGIDYVECQGEADEGCRQLCHDGKAYACLSEDMDMFALGCARVLRYFSLLKHTAVLYNLNSILKILNMNFATFQNLCLLSSTDNNKNPRGISYYYYNYLYPILHSTLPCSNIPLQINVNVIQTDKLHQLLKDQYFLTPQN